MKKTVGTALGLLFLPLTLWAKGPRYQLEVKGLTCPFCAYGLEKKLDKIENIKSMDINIDEGLVTVIMKDGSTLKKKQAKEAITKAGFTLEGFQEQ